MIRGITFSEQLNTSDDFAHFQNTFLERTNGITKGCEMTTKLESVFIQKGYFIICGRFVRIVGEEEIRSPEVISGQLFCKTVFEVDLNKTNSPSEFKQGYFKVLYNENAYPDVVQEDLDNGGTIYQMPWCQYEKRVAGISNFRDLREIIDLTSVWKAVSNQNVNYKREFDDFFGEQAEEIRQMIRDLENEGYSSIVVTKKDIPVPDRKANTFYFRVTDQSTISTVQFKASPEVGFRII